MKFVFDTADLAILARAFAAAPELARDEARRFLHAATEYLKGEVVERTPAAAGTLRASIAAAVEEDGPGLLGVVATALDYAVPVELGTRPHKPPIEPLEQWVRTRLGLTDKAAASAARRIQWKIAHYGTPAAGMFHRGVAAGRANVERLFADGMARLRDRIVGAAR
ncbi:MAG: HK97 gp10 family phage protein [Rhodocyclaceae bacterium]|jgi:energy-converting hydrogenase Eha subunit B|nr:HK97 gp10 family phage protein [Rhodocyclaceae bacterium]MBK6555398.1 HK97 gp10 family phage protein [Rhodocyclaceae bacterium]MBK6676696.1 HK97 gp10 family phage protein [Rhodocyclaceae bacterium]MBK9309320.1 HK97 gp10 family phage protein [Rhodocyclaceae bacterium]MBK9955585.1 HK97 gp10 family phage protein [Rhodocyclaceae bacterium]